MTVRPLTLLALLIAPGLASATDFDVSTMERHGRSIYEAGIAPEEQERLKAIVVQSLDNVAAYYGERQADIPDIYWCASKECAIYFAGTEWRSFAIQKGGRRHADGKHWFERPSIVINELVRTRSKGSANPTYTVTHELAHLEMGARLKGGSVPAWFNEGLASYVGKLRCKPDSIGIDDLGKLKDGVAWRDYTRPSGPYQHVTYCQARQEVGGWIERNGGTPALLNLLAQSRDGRFYQAYGPMAGAKAAAPDTAAERIRADE
jgi:hypothetical protein